MPDHEPAKEVWPTFDDDDLPATESPTAKLDDPSTAGTLIMRVPPQSSLPPQLPAPPPPQSPVSPQPTVALQSSVQPQPPVPPQPPVSPQAPLTSQAWPPPEPPRAAPLRVGPPPPPVEPPKPRRRGRRVALLIVAILVVVAGAGTGTVFLVPGLSDKLGLTSSDPTVTIQPPPSPVQFAPALRAPGGEGAGPSESGLQGALAGPTAAPGLGTLTGVVVDPVTGKTLWQKGGGTPLVPASTGKILTAAAALLSLNHTDQLTTTVVTGKDPGSVVIVGGGDPTLSSLKVGAESVYPGAAHLSELVEQVKASGKPVNTVYVDINRYAGKGLDPSWDPADVAGGHIAPIVPAMLDGGRNDATAAVSRRSDNPARALADEFAKRIGATVAPDAATTAPQGAQVLGEVRSAPVVELVDNLLQRSDNVLAETMAREVAKATGEETSFAGASRATAKVLQQNGFDTNGLSLADGSGLSGQNKVPASLLAGVLAVAAGPDGKDPRTAKLRPLLGGLPVAGGSGTLADRYNTPGTSTGRGWVRAKTGTLQTPLVNSLAGVVLDADGRLLVFALMSNGSTTAVGRPALDAVAATLRKCGCQ